MLRSKFSGDHRRRVRVYVAGFVVACGLLAAAAYRAGASGDPSPRVKTAAGVLEGTHHGAVDVFLGVPYAHPPVGNLRWRAPAPVASWQGVREAKSFGPSCYQPWPPPSFGPYTREYVDTPPPSEDCLYLNVWTRAAHGAQLPVFVWIHGGGFLGGSGAVPIYDGTHLAEQGVVVVTINYRLGPFGFLAHPELTAEARGESAGNYGLQDIVAALDWVRQNVAAFGGNPAAVTVAGQSAGAVAVNDLLVSPRARGLFQRAIAQSGSGLGIDAPTRANAEHDGERFAQQLGVSGLIALRALPAEKIQAAVAMPFLPRPVGALPPILFRPQVDGVWVPVDPVDGAANARANVPLLTGFNADEFLPLGAVSRLEFERTVRAKFGAHADHILALYPHATDDQADASARLLQRDQYMTSLRLWAARRAEQPGQQIFAYYFEHPAPVPAGPSFGTFHSSEIPYVFGVLDRTVRPFTADDERIAAQLQAHWLAFIRTGHPGTPGAPAWNAATPTTVTFMGLGDRIGPRTVVSTVERFDALRNYVEAGGRLSMN